MHYKSLKQNARMQQAAEFLVYQRRVCIVRQLSKLDINLQLVGNRTHFSSNLYTSLVYTKHLKLVCALVFARLLYFRALILCSRVRSREGALLTIQSSHSSLYYYVCKFTLLLRHR